MTAIITTVLGTRSEVDVFFKCPHCCVGEKEIRTTLRGSSRRQFVREMLTKGGIRIDCVCGRNILLRGGGEVDMAIAALAEKKPRKVWLAVLCLGAVVIGVVLLLMFA